MITPEPSVFSPSSYQSSRQAQRPFHLQSIGKRWEPFSGSADSNFSPMAGADVHWSPRNGRDGAEEDNKREKQATSFTFYGQSHSSLHLIQRFIFAIPIKTAAKCECYGTSRYK